MLQAAGSKQAASSADDDLRLPPLPARPRSDPAPPPGASTLEAAAARQPAPPPPPPPRELPSPPEAPRLIRPAPPAPPWALAAAAAPEASCGEATTCSEAAGSTQRSEACSEAEAASAQRSEASEAEGPPRPRPVLAVLCDGQRFESDPQDDLKGFRQRAENSFFQALLDPEADQFKDESGAMVIRDMPLSTVEAVWRYLTLGFQPSLSTLSEYREWRRVCDYFALVVHDPLADVRRCAEASALATSRYLMVKTADMGRLSPLCYAMRCGGDCGLEAAPLGFDQVCLEGTLHLQAEHCDPPLEVRLDPSSGALTVRFMREAVWQHVGRHACLQSKRMVALKVRFPKRQWPYKDPSNSELQVTELYIHARPSRRHGEPSAIRGSDVCIATWPSFWCLVRILRRRAPGHEVWSSWNARFEILPGAVCVMADGLLVQVVSQPRSIHKCYVRICGADWEHEVCAKLLAPTPHYRYQCQKGKGGKGKAGYFHDLWHKGSGMGPTLEGGQKYYKYRVPSYDTPTPEDAARNVTGRCMQQVWIIRRRSHPKSTPHMVILLHSIDGRVAVAQLSGDHGCVPPLYGTGGPSGRFSRTCAIWGAKAWHWDLQDEVMDVIGQYSRSYDVPKCHEVMGMALQDSSRILVLHRPRSRGSPQLWTINQPKAPFDGGMPSFFRVHGKGRGKGFKGGSMGYPVGGSWFDDRWGTMGERQVVLPEDIVAGLDAESGTGLADCPLLVPLWTKGEVSAAPEVEVLRLNGRAEVSGWQACGRRGKGYGGAHGGAVPQAGGRRGKGYGGAHGGAVPQASWHITGRLHYRCREPVLPT